jgi:adenylyltransferase/sulfurtransferase
MKISNTPDYFNRQDLVLEKGTGDKIKKTSLLVIGAGAGGNELLKNLVLMGFGHMTIIDFDYIEDSNLSKSTLFKKEDIGKSKALVAAERLNEYALHDNPSIIGIHGNLITEVGKGIIKDHDIVICCVDTMNARAYINDWCVRLAKPFFEMGFENFDVNISFFCPNENGFQVCLREQIGQGIFDSNRNSCSGYKKDDKDLAKIPTIQFTAALAGVLIATEIVKFLNGNSSLKNKTLFFYGRTFETLIISYKPDITCKIHEEFNLQLIEVDTPENISLKQYIDNLQKITNDKILLKLPETYVISAKCHGCGSEIVYEKRQSIIYDYERWCTHCRESENFTEQLNFERNVNEISELHENCENQILNRKFDSLGVPENEIMFATGLNEFPPNYYHFKNKLI